MNDTKKSEKEEESQMENIFEPRGQHWDERIIEEFWDKK